MHNPDSTTDDARTTRIQAEAAAQRLDRYVQSQFPDLSRTSIQQLITDGAVLVNERVSKPGYALRTGDLVQVLSLQRQQISSVQPQTLPLDIVYEDDDLLVVNKAAGMVTHPAPGHQSHTLVNALLAYRPELQGIGGEERPGIVHRLDKDTSGLLIVAKNTRALTALAEMQQRHAIHKRYLALVSGSMPLDQGSIDAPIGRDPRNRQQMAVTAQGSREARTHFRVLQRFSRHTLLLLELETGRTHQIRVHLKAIGHPVVGDQVYGSSSQREPKLSHQFLHAFQLRFNHPTTGQELELEAPLPPNLQTILDQRETLL